MSVKTGLSPQVQPTALQLMMKLPIPAFLLWGEDLAFYYNPAFNDSLGAGKKNAFPMGVPMSHAWPDGVNLLAPVVKGVKASGVGIRSEQAFFPLVGVWEGRPVSWAYCFESIVDEQGRPAGILVTCMYQALAMARRLIESEARFRALATAAADVVYRMSPDWKEMRALLGRGFLADTGAADAGWLQKYIHPEDQEQVLRAIDAAIRSKSMFELEHRVLRVDGTLGWTLSRAVPILDDGGNIIEWFGAAADITERRTIANDLETTREELEAQKRIYDAVTAATPDLIYVFNLDYTFAYANKALLTMWGRSWEQSIGQGLRAVGYEDWHAEMHEREIDTVVATKQLIRGQVSFPHAVQGRRIYDYIFAPVLDEHGEVIAIAGTTRDISDLKAAEDALRKSEERLEQVVSERTSELQRSNEDLLQFAHVASHDLKEPTRKVRFFADRLLNDTDSRLSSEGKRYVEKINSAADRMFHMIDGVLNYSKVNNLHEAHSAVDLGGLIRQIVLDLEVLIQQKQARVEASELPTIEGSPVLLYQLFYNLINNSLKFAQMDVPAVISIEAAPASIEGRDWWQIDVRDNGIGFPQMYADKIFATFTRLHPKDLYEGTGLGLSLCKKIVERHGGTIRAESRVGEGTVFRIKLPMNAT
jgi:PAS domain S-box-containing protein